MHVSNYETSGNGVVFVGSGMKLSVVSGDDTLITVCREVLRELEDTPEGLPTEFHPGILRNSEICLWDYEPGQDNIPSPRASDGQRVFYLVPPAHLDSLRARIPDAEGNILLKPVTRAVLRTFLGFVALASNGKTPGGTPTELGALRANRDEILQCLLHANLRLQEYDQQRTNFIARAVHDFRAPLTALSGFCGLLTSGELGPLTDVQKEVLERMQHSVKRLSRMASAMFDLSAGPRLSHKLDLREADIREHIRQSIYEILPMAQEKQITLRAEPIVAPPVPLRFEPSQIEQVLLNLLDNACKFTPKHGLIRVLGYPYFWERRFLTGDSPVERRENQVRSPNSYRVDIKDTGPGVPPELLERIFEEYTSYSGSRDRSGGGLGLAVCRLIMSRHQGHVWAELQPQGTVFSFVLPFAQSQSQIDIANKASHLDRRTVEL
jgi:signal transduction histidine kinase